MEKHQGRERIIILGFLFTLLAIAALGLAEFLMVQGMLEDDSSHQGSRIQLAAKQQILSLQVALTLGYLQNEKDPKEIADRKENLASLIGELDRVQSGLRTGDPTMNLPGKPSKAVRALFDQVQPHHVFVSQAIKHWLSSSPEEQARILADHSHFERLLEASERFRSGMELIQKAYEREGSRKFASRSKWNMGLSLTLVAILAAATVFVFWPTVRKIREANRRLSHANAELEHEIAQRILSEEARRQLITAIEQAEESIVIASIDGTIEYVNPAFANNTGYSPDEVLGQSASILQSGEHDEAFYKELWETITSGKVWRGRMVNHRKNGVQYIEQASISPVRDQSGELVKFIAVTRDISNEVRLEAQLQRAQKLEAIGSLAGGIAHEFNNLLTPVLGYVELLQHQLKADAKTMEYLRRVQNSALRAKDLVGRILLFSREGGSKLDLVHLGPLAKDVVQLAKASLPPNITIQDDGIGEVPPLRGEPAKLHTMLMNLLVNAGQSMPLGGRISLDLRVANLEAYPTPTGEILDGGHLCLTVADTGEGITPEVKERMFDPFFTTREVGEGTGLGLSMVFGIVQEHDGLIEVDSIQGEGSTFRIYFPMSQAEGPEKEPVTSIPVTARAKTSSAGILLVDDESEVLQLMRVLLERMGHRVYSMSSCREALEILEAHPEEIDLAFVDYLMPEMNGSELAKRLISLRKDLPIILMTGYHDLAPIAEPTAENLFQDILNKPFTYERIESLVNGLLAPGEGASGASHAC